MMVSDSLVNKARVPNCPVRRCCLDTSCSHAQQTVRFAFTSDHKMTSILRLVQVSLFCSHLARAAPFV